MPDILGRHALPAGRLDARNVTAITRRSTRPGAWRAAVPFLFWTPAALAVDQADTLLLAEPDISREHIAFVHDGDIWIAGRDGSGSRRLTTAEGIESRPHFSPDGRAIVFSGNYDGNVDVYVVPIAGGVPKRLTWHGGEDIAEGFAGPDRVLFSSQRDVHTIQKVHLFLMDVGGAFPERLPIPLGHDADVAPDRGTIAYSVMPPMFFRALTQWKGYRGGSVSSITLMDLEDYGMREVPQPPGDCNDLNPMWLGDGLYFNSDRAGEFNLFRFDPQTSAVEQLTFYEDFPVINANSGPGAIIFEQAGRLHILDPATGEVTTLHVATNSDLRETRPRWVSDPEYVRAVSPSPDASRVALEYRGEIVTVPTGKGPVRNLTQSPGAHERSPAWSPSGDRIAWFSDASGEYRLCIAAADGSGDVRCVPIEGGHGFYEDLEWSPDEAYVSFLDNAYSLFVMEVSSGETEVIAGNRFFGHQPFISHRWSPDSRWLAYTRNTNGLIQTVHLWSVEDDESHQVTDGFTEVSEPVFDPNGKYLYVIASDEAGPVKDWFALSSLDMTFTHAVYAIVLDADAPSPLPPEGSMPPAGGERQTEGDGQEEGEPPPVTIDFEGIRTRIVSLPTEAATIRNLQVGRSGELLYLASPAIPAIKALSSPAALERFTLGERATTTLLDGVDDYRISRDGKTLLFRQKAKWKTAAAAAKIEPGKAKPLPVGRVSVHIDPRREWRQIAREVWRLNRDYFYDPNYHGVDWNAAWEKYAPFLEHAATRADVGRIISWMLSELRVGHSYSTPGETIDEPPDVKVGLLGADFAIEEGRYRFEKIYGGLNWRPELRSPLTVPGESVAEGEYLIAVAGEPLTADDNVYSRFDNLVGKPVEIMVAPRADGDDARTVTVVPIADDLELRYVDWVASNIRKVDAATDGRVAYVHVPDTSVSGHAAFKRYFYPQSHKDALIIDDRNNGGGFVADYYIDILRREPVLRWATRYGDDLVTPRAAIHGPKVMIINEGAGSGGDLLPWMFRKFDLGTIVGTRTWGGLVGNLEIHRLMDGSTTTAPNIAGWTPEDGWIIENDGVAPDIEVDQSPRSFLAGRDPQLEKAIEVALRSLENEPPRRAERPPYPDHIP